MEQDTSTQTEPWLRAASFSFEVNVSFAGSFRINGNTALRRTALASLIDRL
jgi:hypothetical protein